VREDDALGREVWLVAGVVVVGVIMSILDTTIVNVALETLSRDLHASLNSIQWVSTGYLLSLATVIPLAGWASEHFGAKRVWMISVGLFVAGSVLCGAAWSVGSLIFFRVLQGFGGGLIMPVGMSVLTQTAGPTKVGRVMSVIGVPMLLGPILGPVIGGLILNSISWRWIFFVNVPVGALGLALAWRLLPGDAGRADAGALDWRGLLLLSPGLGAVVFGLSETETHGGIGAPIAFGPIVAGLALVVLFAVHALRAPRPLIDVRLFRKPQFAAATSTTFFLGAGLFGAMIVIPLYYQVARGESPLTAGLLMAPQGLGAAMVMPLAGRLTDRLGGGRVAIVGLIVCVIATLPFVWVGPHTSYGWLAAVLVVRGMGFGSAMMPSMAAAFATLERAAVPRATAALNVFQRVGGSVGTAFLAVILQNRIKANLPAAGSGQNAIRRLPAGVRERVAEPLAHAFAQTFWWALALLAIAIVPAGILAVLSRPRRGARPEGPPPSTPESPLPDRSPARIRSPAA
jgi:EmrB/QacA subfamily drug resistance transporter